MLYPHTVTSGLCPCPNEGSAQLKGVRGQGKRRTSARVWGAASFVRAQASAPRSPRPFCSWMLSYSRHINSPVTQGLRGGWGEQPPGPETAPLPLLPSTLQPWGGLFLSLPFYLLCQNHVRLENAVVFAL